MKPENLSENSAAHDIYEGLDWKQGASKRMTAVSDTTGATYMVEVGAGDLWCVRNGFTSRPGRPNILIGQYVEPDVALVAAERHDFNYWKSVSERAGIKCIFLGSKGSVSDFVAAIPEHDRDEATQMLVSEYITADGRPFSSAASFFAAQKTALKQERNGRYSLTLAIDAEATPLWLMQAPLSAELTLGAVLDGDPVDNDWIERGKVAVRRAAVLPADNSFQGWMLQRYDKWSMIKTAMAKTTDDVEAAVAETIRRLIGCPTRRDLATNRDAIMRIERLDREFYTDLSRGL